MLDVSIRCDVFIRYLELPIHTEAVVLPNDDNTFDIYLNSRLCPRKQQEALEHELNHLRMDHLYSEEPVEKNEEEAG